MRPAISSTELARIGSGMTSDEPETRKRFGNFIIAFNTLGIRIVRESYSPRPSALVLVKPGVIRVSEFPLTVKAFRGEHHDTDKESNRLP